MFTQKMKTDTANKFKDSVTLDQPEHEKLNFVSSVVKKFAEGIAKKRDEGRVSKA